MAQQDRLTDQQLWTIGTGDRPSARTAAPAEATSAAGIDSRGVMSRVIACLPIGDDQASNLDAYRRQHHLSAICADYSLDHLAAQIDVWHRFIGDLRGALEGEHSFEVDGEVQGHQNLVMRLEVIALSTSKAALDCCLGGLYVQASMLTRHLFETWQRMAYTFLNPQSVYDWLSPTGAIPTPPGLGTFSRGLRNSSRQSHKFWAPIVEKRIRALDLYAHPTYRTLTAQDTLHEGFISLGGAFNGETARDVIRNATIAQMLILQEHSHHMPHMPEWYDRHRDSVLALRDAFPELGIRIE